MSKKIILLLLALSLTAGMRNTDVYGAGDTKIIGSKTVIEVTDSDGTYMAGSNNVLSENLELMEKVKTAADDFSSAIPIRMGNTISGSVTETVDNRLYQFTLSESGRVALDLTSYMKYCSMFIYGSDGTLIWYDDNNVWNESLKYFKNTYEIDLTDGVYYFKVTGYRYKTNSSYASTGTYTIGTKFISAEESCKEPNNDFANASIIGINGTVKGQIAENDKYDIYKFTLAKSGRIEIAIRYYMCYNGINLYDNAGKEIWYSYDNVWNENLKYKTDAYNLDLTSGTYYIKITGYRYRTSSGYADTGSYSFNMKYTDAKVNYQEPNNDFSEAFALRTDTKLKGQIAINDPYDILKFSLTRDRDVRFIMTSYMKYYTLDLYDRAGKRIWYTNWNKWNDSAGYRKDVNTVTLSAGSYYLKVTGYSAGTANASTGTYTLFVDTRISMENVTAYFTEYKPYTGKVVKPSVKVKYHGATLRKGKDYEISYKNNKNIGAAMIHIKGKGNYTGTKKIKFCIVPMKPTVTKAKNSGKGAVTLKWKRDKNVSGYEIYRSVKRKSGYIKIKDIPRNKTVSFKDKNLFKGRTYYYIIRSYNKIKGWTYYGFDSKERAVKIKR